MTSTYIFLCPSCSKGFQVDKEVRDQMLSEGCVFCKADISAADFERDGPEDTSDRATMQ